MQSRRQFIAGSTSTLGHSFVLVLRKILGLSTSFGSLLSRQAAATHSRGGSLPARGAFAFVRPLPPQARIVDPDTYHLFVSLGCAAENFLIAAAANGRPGSITFAEGSKDYIDIELADGCSISDALYPAILENQSTRIDLRQQTYLHHRPEIIGVQRLHARCPSSPRYGRQEARRYSGLVLRGNDNQVDD